ncbi:CUE domain-containing protein 2-like [Uloborus diversus]|uniref:CUE domain-containing protein 2-like n=1 Tax=Uloborus diversus TaxID=327109 RepID=UPI0024096715|nr:CUE domain-containing protein 2-like [Uloborus diversus]
MSSSETSNFDQDTFVKAELNRFILDHTGIDSYNSIDEIVLSYIVGVLENVGSAYSPEDAFDVIEFSEVMSAYIPPFSNINSCHISEWMLQFAAWLKKMHNDNASHSRRKSYSSRSCSSSQSDDDERCINVSECEMSSEVEILLEMFPNLHVLEAKQFFCTANGNYEKAVQLILQKQESEEEHECLVTKSIVKQNVGHPKEAFTTDKKLRDQILQRYAYIDQVDDVREHKPVAPKMEPKKLIRYRDNKIVSIKGEKFSEVKREVTDETKDKILLKPAKKHRL